MSGDHRERGPAPNPWDREFIVDAQSRRRQDGAAAAAALPARTAPADGASAPRRPGSPGFLVLAPWAGVVGLACGAFGAVAPWLLDCGDSSAILIVGVVAVLLGIYAALGTWRKRGRADIATGAILLGLVGIALWFMVSRPSTLLTPT